LLDKLEANKTSGVIILHAGSDQYGQREEWLFPFDLSIQVPTKQGSDEYHELTGVRQLEYQCTGGPLREDMQKFIHGTHACDVPVGEEFLNWDKAVSKVLARSARQLTVLYLCGTLC